MKNLLKWFEYRLDIKTGMIGITGYWNFVDWSFPTMEIPSGGIEGNSSILSLQYIYTLDQSAQIFRYFKQQDNANYYNNLAQRIKKFVYAKCYDSNRRLLADTSKNKAFSQHANIWSIHKDCIPLKYLKATMEKVINDQTLTIALIYHRFYYQYSVK